MFFPRQNADNARDVCLVTMKAWFPGTWPTATAPRSTKAKGRAKLAAQSRLVATDPDDKGRVGPLFETIPIADTTPVANANSLYNTSLTFTNPTPRDETPSQSLGGGSEAPSSRPRGGEFGHRVALMEVDSEHRQVALEEVGPSSRPRHHKLVDTGTSV